MPKIVYNVRIVGERIFSALFKYKLKQQKFIDVDIVYNLGSTCEVKKILCLIISNSFYT